jgi:cytochrome c
MKNRRILSGIALVLFLTSFGDVQENSTPIVKILDPHQNNGFSWNQLIPFKISIEDKEDGNSDYDEISNNEVILTVHYLSDSLKVKHYLAQNIQENYDVLSWMGSSNCFTCHAANDRLIGPSFSEISLKYMGDMKKSRGLAQKIINGAKGVWGNQIMPAHPHLDLDKVKEAVDWILSTGANADFSYYAGTQGAFRTRQQPRDGKGPGVYVLSGHYRDKGANGAVHTSKMGLHTIVLKHKQ